MLNVFSLESEHIYNLTLHKFKGFLLNAGDKDYQKTQKKNLQ
jgi:hypothetical protein